MPAVLRTNLLNDYRRSGSNIGFSRWLESKQSKNDNDSFSSNSSINSSLVSFNPLITIPFSLRNQPEVLQDCLHITALEVSQNQKGVRYLRTPTNHRRVSQISPSMLEKVRSKMNLLVDAMKVLELNRNESEMVSFGLPVLTLDDETHDKVILEQACHAVSNQSDQSVPNTGRSRSRVTFVSSGSEATSINQSKLQGVSLESGELFYRGKKVVDLNEFNDDFNDSGANNYLNPAELFIVGEQTPYNLFELKGAGMFGSVYIAANETRVYAVKLQAVDQKSESKVLGEAKKSKLISGVPFQMTTYKAGYLNDDKGCFLIMELSDHSLLEHFKGRSFKPESREDVLIFYQLMYGLSQLHKRGLYHNDINLNNILLDNNNRPTWCDYGESKTPGSFRFDTKPKNIYLDLPLVSAPKSHEEKKRYLENNDNWRLGQVMYSLWKDKLAAHPYFDANFFLQDKKEETVSVPLQDIQATKDPNLLYLNLMQSFMRLGRANEKIMSVKKALQHPLFALHHIKSPKCALGE